MVSSQERSKCCTAEAVLVLLVAFTVVVLVVVVGTGRVVVATEVIGCEVVVISLGRSLELDPGETLVSTKNFLLPPLIAGSGLS